MSTDQEVSDHQQKLHAAYHEFFNSDSGKVILADLWSFCGVMDTMEVLGSDPYWTYFNLGKRRVFLRIYNWIYRQASTDFELPTPNPPPDPYDLHEAFE